MSTFQTKDFEIYLFDINNTNIRNVLQIKVEDLYSKLNKDFIKNIAFISPANVLGFMDGGVDKGYMNCIPNIQNLVQNGFKELSYKSMLDRNYLPIGCSMAFKITDNITFISAPTMLLPQKVLNTDNPYHSLKSSLQLCKELNIKHIFCPMMCTGYGGYSYEDSFKLMTTAINDYHLEKFNSDIKTIKNYSYNMLINEEIELITIKQPKIYCNTEFYVKM
jgi:hypothetical protein